MSKDKKQLAPFIHTEKNAPYIYMTLLASLIPCAVCGIYYYGLRAAVLILFCMLAFVMSDNLCARVTGRRSGSDYFDFSSLVEGLLLALMLPPDTTLIIALIAVLFASVITKQVFGGAGSNLINPACAGRLFIELVFPSGVQGFSYGEENSRFALMSLVFQGEPVRLPDYSGFSFLELISGNYPGLIGTACFICIMIGGLFLTLKGTMRLYSPISYILTLMLLYPMSMLVETGTFSFDGMIVYLLSSGVFFIAVFLLGDLTTMPSRFAAGVFAGVVCGLLTMVTKPFLSPMVSMLSPVLAVNFLSFVLDFFSKTLSRRKIRSREVDLS
ncbi:RnfABCDGE type electron transport complex subunit D [Butyrivibrio sp. AE2032]|uniref:RnfABCDGE type electron transport complex subunit D n=1 Tax=Butyrivibrio sp. AE2032 TaxID=1458463 RepID=UPI000557DB42|nr:RnfABCDGE type electron transport complex subunit D [Butyrivibrio sp. AE2032]